MRNLVEEKVVQTGAYMQAGTKSLCKLGEL